VGADASTNCGLRHNGITKGRPDARSSIVSERSGRAEVVGKKSRPRGEKEAMCMRDAAVPSKKAITLSYEATIGLTGTVVLGLKSEKPTGGNGFWVIVDGR